MSEGNAAHVTPHAFAPGPGAAQGVMAYIHLGDLHMVDRSQQNFADLRSIVSCVNRKFPAGVSFVYLPGDIADNGSRTAYFAVRACMDQLALPWFGIVGDHDVHEKSFANFRAAIENDLYSAFTVGGVRFIRLNAFAEPRPDSFLLGEQQFAWLEGELAQASSDGLDIVLFMHFYPSELKVGSDRLGDLIRRYHVRLVDMGHTHYNEISNDGHTLYAATRSTGQIEEGNAGYTLVTLDRGVVSWHFFEPQEGPIVVITSPSDERLLPEENPPGNHGEMPVIRACVWSESPIQSVYARLGEKTIELHRVGNSVLWTSGPAGLPLSEGTYGLEVHAQDADNIATDRIRFAAGNAPARKPERKDTDAENALGAWEERGLLGTQLGPNKNGRKW